jgi:hypothetical protein
LGGVRLQAHLRGVGCDWMVGGAGLKPGLRIGDDAGL